jgi:tetratricopeptide (TPR) repeat protein
MANTRTGLRLGMVVAALGLAAWLVGPAEAADDEAALRKKVLALNHITGDETVRGEILTLVEDPAGTKKLLPIAAKLAREKPSPLNYNAAYILARCGQRLKDYDSTLPLYRVCIDRATQVKSPTRLFEGYAGLIAAHYDKGKYEDAIKVAKEFLEIAPEPLSEPGDIDTRRYNATLGRAKQLMRRELIPILTKQGKVEDANTIVDNMLKENPDDLEALELRALLQRETGKYEAAIKTYDTMIGRINDAIEKIKKNKEASQEDKDAAIKELNEDVREYRYNLSGLYIDANQVDKAADVLKSLLKEDPDNPGFNNDLGYIWADHNMNLDESEKLIRKAIDEDKKLKQKRNPDLKPDQVKPNPAYLDSLGWVLYKQKKYKDALPPLEEAVKADDGQSIEIYDHLADVHIALGNKAEAVATWKKGLEQVGSSKREQERKTEVEKKLKAAEGKK